MAPSRRKKGTRSKKKSPKPAPGVDGEEQSALSGAQEGHQGGTDLVNADGVAAAGETAAAAEGNTVHYAYSLILRL